ncbi:MAG: transcriptional regulator [Thaumarchaeota archaeon]|nr:transcriptional regulator [Nitrososphaerota archaeon]
MSEEVPLTPVGRDQIHKLESALLIASIFSPTVLEELENPKERLTWIDSLAVAAAALAREKAKMSVSQIADELGRSEATIRNHLQGKTKAGQIVRETYERFVREGVSIPSLPELFKEKYAPLAEKEDVEKLKSEIESLKSQLEQYKSKIEEYEKKISDAKTVLSSVAETINRLISEI